MYRRILHAGGQDKGIMLIAGRSGRRGNALHDSAQAAEPCLAVFVKAYKNNIAVALIPAFIKPPVWMQ